LWRYGRLFILAWRGELGLADLQQGVDDSTQLHARWQVHYALCQHRRQPLAYSILRAFPALCMAPTIPGTLLMGYLIRLTPSQPSL
jgi:hypothetical protein